MKRSSGITLSAFLELYDPTGAREASECCGENVLIDRRLASSGTYTLVARSSGGTTGPYTLSWALDRITPIPLPGAATGQITDPGQGDRYTFEGRQGQQVQARMRRTAGITLSTFLELYDPTGTREASECCGESVVIDRRLASSGTYTLVARSSGGTTGPYSIDVR